MCSTCGDVAVEYLLAGAETELILAEADAGESVTKAIRPLNNAERRAGMRFGEIEKAEQKAAEKAAEIIDEIAQVYIIAIIGEVFSDKKGMDSAGLAAAIASINVSMPHAAKDSMSAAADRLATVLAEAHAAGQSIALDEARRQGVGRVPKPTAAPAAFFVPMAQAVALHPWTRIAGKLQADYLSPATLNRAGDLLRADVEKAAKAIPLDGALDLASQSIHSAHGSGRAEVAAELEPAEIWASELMDGATCGPCARVDGKEYDTLADGLVEYETGGYGACDGGARCRGTLVFVYQKV